jgi:hypothetical protein
MSREFVYQYNGKANLHDEPELVAETVRIPAPETIARQHATNYPVTSVSVTNARAEFPRYVINLVPVDEFPADSRLKNPMGIWVVAFHETVAAERIDRLFTSSKMRVVIEARSLGCSVCNARFAAVLLDKSDPDNEGLMCRLEALIADDCRAGEHRNEYFIEYFSG